jgi:hypothetical protein
MRGAAEPGVEIQALIPQRSGIGDLGHGAPEEHGDEIGNPADMAQRFQDQSGRLSATRRTAVDAHVGRAPQKLGLGPRLRGDCRREWKCHVSPPERSDRLLRGVRKPVTSALRESTHYVSIYTGRADNRF